MFKIGEFSRFSRVSVKMLRHYDQIDLLKPAFVDPQSGYRYYSADQLPRLNRIILLKDLDFSLDEIRFLLDADLTSADVDSLFKVKQSQIRARIAADQQRLQALAQTQSQLIVSESPLSQAFIVRQVEDQLVASIRRSVAENAIAPLFEQLEQIVAQHDARALRPPLMIYHDSEFVDSEQDIEVAVPITEAFDAPDPVQVDTLKGATMACIVYLGDYASTAPLIRRFPAWLEANGYAAAGALREVYLRFGADNMGYTLPDVYLTDTAVAYVTELQLPVVRVESEE